MSLMVRLILIFDDRGKIFTLNLQQYGIKVIISPPYDYKNINITHQTT